ncbi:MAG: hypothetical protein AAFW89_03845 [Bacteroidota bacterium]
MLLALVILITAFLLNLLLPWWSIAIAGLVAGFFFKKNALPSFGWGFLALFLLWGLQSTFIHIMNHGVLSSRIAHTLQVGNPYLVILATAVIGGLVGGLSCMTGALWTHPKRNLART